MATIPAVSYYFIIIIMSCIQLMQAGKLIPRGHGAKECLSPPSNKVRWLYSLIPFKMSLVCDA